MPGVKESIMWHPSVLYVMSTCGHTCHFLCVYACRHTLSAACVCWESRHLQPYSHTTKGTPSWPSKERSTKMTATLHFLWGLSPICLCTSATLSQYCFQVPLCFSQLIRKFHSFLSPLLPACPCALGASMSSQQSLQCSPIILSFPNMPTTTNFAL